MGMSRRRRAATNGPSRLVLLASPMVVLVLMSATAVKSAGPQATLAPPESFAGISNIAAQSAALFTEAGKVLTSRRCVNCHPAGDRPLQGEEGRLHQPPVERGVDGAPRRCVALPATRPPTSIPPACPATRIGTWRPGKWDGRARQSTRSARRSRIRRATEAARFNKSRRTSPMTRWSVGPGRRASDASRLLARKSNWPHLLKRG